MTTPETNQITADGLRKLQDELAQLEGPRRKEIADRIQTARAFGDLKENADYHDAKNEQAFVETKIARLRERLTHAVVTEQENGPGARFGSQVALRDEQNGKEVSYRLVGATEADVKQGRLSIESPVAQAIVGRSPGDLVRVRTPSGERSYTVLTVE